MRKALEIIGLELDEYLDGCTYDLASSGLAPWMNTDGEVQARRRYKAQVQGHTTNRAWTRNTTYAYDHWRP